MKIARPALLLLLTALPAAAQAPASEADVPRITVAELLKAREGGQVLVIDVRDAGSYAAGHVAGAVSIPEAQLPAVAERLKAERRAIVTYCA